MIKQQWLVVILFSVLFATTGCYIDGNGNPFDCVRADGDIVTKELSISNFTGVKLAVNADVFITQGDDFLVEVKGSDNIVDLIETKVQNDIWIIDFDQCVRNVKQLEIFITMPTIEYLKVSGSGLIRGENTFTVNDVELYISGSGDMDLALEGDDIDGKISGSGDMRLEGFAQKMKFKINGSGDLRAFDYKLERVNIQISGSGDAEVRASDDLDVKITGSGDVYYKGNPSVNVQITGSGKVIDAN